MADINLKATNQVKVPKRNLTPEQSSWEAHRDLTANIVHAEVGFRGCFGLAMMLDTIASAPPVDIHNGTEDRIFVPDVAVRWASIVDIPHVNWRVLGQGGKNDKLREIHWTTVRKTSVRFGFPTLCGPSMVNMDMKKYPNGKRVSQDCTFLVDNPRLFRIFNAIEWAMTTTAFAYRPAWQRHRGALAKAFGFSETTKTNLLAFGGGLYDTVQRPHLWMPKPYLAIRDTSLNDLYGRVTRVLGNDLIHYSDPLKDAFTRAMVDDLAYRSRYAGKVFKVDRFTRNGLSVCEVELRGNAGERDTLQFLSSCQIYKLVGQSFAAGEVIAKERFTSTLPPSWLEWHPQKCWNWSMDKLRPGMVDNLMRLWFYRQGIKIKPEITHFSADLVSVAAISSSVAVELFWDITEATNYFDPNSDAMIFPTVKIMKWSDLTGKLPGEITYDLTPISKQFVPYGTEEATQRKYSR